MRFNPIVGWMVGVVLLSMGVSCFLVMIIVTSPDEVKKENHCNDIWSFSNNTYCGGSDCRLIQKNDGSVGEFVWDCTYKGMRWSTGLIIVGMLMALGGLATICGGHASGFR